MTSRLPIATSCNGAYRCVRRQKHTVELVRSRVEDAEENWSPADDRRSSTRLYLPRRPAGEIRQTIRHLYLRAGSPVNLGEQLVVTVLNTVTGMMWSRTVKGGLMVAEEREGLGAEFRRLVGEFTLMLGTPNVSDFFPLLRRFDLQGVQKRMKECSGRFDKIFDEIITQRLTLMDQNEENESGRRKDFLQILLELKNNAPADGKTPLTITHAKALFTDMIFGATDTTTSTMEYAMAEIMNKPEVMNKLQQEIDTIVGKDNIVEESHIHKLPYLLAVVKETLPPLPFCPFWGSSPHEQIMHGWWLYHSRRISGDH
ncbi:hypothetical protein Ancab_010014 [Ancistrocladus abbreviatus]